MAGCHQRTVGTYLKCGWWLGRPGARCRGMTIPSLFPPSPATLLGGFLTSDTDRITSWNCWVLSASFWAIKAILSLNFLGLLPAMVSLVVLSLNHNKNENYFTEYLCSQQMWWLLIYHCRGDKDFPTLKLHILKVLLNFFRGIQTTVLYFRFSIVFPSITFNDTKKDL